MSKVDAQINALVQKAHDDGAEPNTAVTPEDGLVVYAGMGGGSTLGRCVCNKRLYTSAARRLYSSSGLAGSPEPEESGSHSRYK